MGSARSSYLSFLSYGGYLKKSHRKDFCVNKYFTTSDMKSKILAVLLLLSILTNIYLIQVQPSSKDLLKMKDKINQLEITNSQMSKQIYRDNLSIKNYASQLDLYREKISYLEIKLNNTPTGLSGTAKLEALLL